MGIGALGAERDRGIREGAQSGSDRVRRGVDGASRGGRDVGGAGSQEGRQLVWFCEAMLASIEENLDLGVQVADVLVDDTLKPLGEDDLLVGKLLCLGEVGADQLAVRLLLRVGRMAAVRLDPFLNAAVAIFYYLDALGGLAILVRDLILDELDLLGQVSDAVCPVVEDEGGIEGGVERRHDPRHEVDGEIVSRHYGQSKW